MNDIIHDRLIVCTLHESALKYVFIAVIAVNLQLSRFAQTLLVITNNNTNRNDDQVKLYNWVQPGATMAYRDVVVKLHSLKIWTLDDDVILTKLKLKLILLPNKESNIRLVYKTG
jgi:hypothetical protein